MAILNHQTLSQAVRNPIWKGITPIVLILLGIIFLGAGMVIGVYEVSFWRVWEIVAHYLLNFGTEATKVEKIVVWELRFPRGIAAFLVGSTLAATGAVMQGLFRNPLADPGLIGVSAGASLAAAAGIVLGGTWFVGLYDILGFLLVPIFAFFGGIAVTFFIYTVSLTPKGVSVVTMLLAGIAINALAGAASGTLTYISTDQQLRDLAFWSLGSLGGVGWDQMMVISFLIVVNLIILKLGKGLNALLLGESEARHLGIDTKIFNRLCIILTALGVGVCVSVAGAIGFVGIVVPHLLRLVLGPDHRYLLPNSMLLGGVMLLIADILSKIISPPEEIPIGILTAAIGAPFFLWILLRHKRKVGL